MICSVTLLAILVQSAQNERTQNENAVAEQGNKVTESQKISLPTFGEAVLLCSPAVKQLCDHEITEAEAISGGETYRAMNFSHRLDSQSGTLLISEELSFSKIREYVLGKDSEMMSIDNLKTGITYYYRALVGEEVYECTLETEKPPRFISIPGLKNTRDIGGYTTMYGYTVKQGWLTGGLESDGLAKILLHPQGYDRRSAGDYWLHF